MSQWSFRFARNMCAGICALAAIALVLSRIVGVASGSAASLAQSAPAPASPSQVDGVSVVHQQGQTFVQWRELGPAPKDQLTAAEFSRVVGELESGQRIRYRVYRSERPIRRLEDAELLAEVAPLSGWNGTHFGFSPPPDAVLPRFAIRDQANPLPSGTGLLVYEPKKAGQAFYAVTVSARGAENRTVTTANTTETGVAEAVGPAVPVLQRVDKPPVFNFVEGATLKYYVRWESMASRGNVARAFNYLTAIPRDVRYPAPVGIHLHCWNASMMFCWGWWYNADKGAILLSSNEDPYDWWTGYHELLWRDPPATPEEWQRGVIRPYTQRRLLSFLDWLATIVDVDQSRVFAGGNSMGGSGAIMLAIRYPQRIAWAVSWVGVHDPSKTPQFKSSYELVYGKREWNLKFEDGTPVWDYFNDAWYLRHHRDQDVGFITFSNGKNDDAIGWLQAVEFLRALQETRQPHLFVWGQDSHSQRALMPAGGGEQRMPLDLRTNQSLPAFTGCSLDDDAGDGSPDSGARTGQVNAYLTWRPETIVDERDRWSLVISLIDRAPKPAATVDVTPRRLQQFNLKPGEAVTWTNSAGSTVIQRGELTADEWGRVTLPRVQVTRDGSRITVTRKVAAAH